VAGGAVLPGDGNADGAEPADGGECGRAKYDAPRAEAKAKL
jgi:hypothetical protein